MSDANKTPWWFSWLWTWACMLVVFGVGTLWGMRAEQQRAIEAGVGCYVTNPETGKADFVYGVTP